eukprot:c18630_g1_i1.p1 GENE.c18630_g1_i1~~c18630_g1_i1.p1  ORF type:complete len:171 (+),score=54.78 c18630_g1_i1:347-859(+)
MVVTFTMVAMLLFMTQLYMVDYHFIMVVVHKKKDEGFNSTRGVCVGNVQTLKTCFCCLEKQGDVWEDVSDCDQIKGKLKSLIVSTFTFNLLAFVFLIMTCCGYCIVCATSDINNQQQQQNNPYGYPVAVANLATPFGYGNAPVANAVAATPMAPVALAAPTPMIQTVAPR